MPRKPKNPHPLAPEISSIRALLQDMMIMQGAQLGIKKAQVRKIVSVDVNRVTRIWKHLKLKQQ